MKRTDSFFCQQCGTALEYDGRCPRCSPEITPQEKRVITSKIVLMPHSTEQEPGFETVDDFIHYLRKELPEDNNWTYRNNHARGPDKCIFVFKGKILGECELLDYEKREPKTNYNYKYAYSVKKHSIRIYDRI